MVVNAGRDLTATEFPPFHQVWNLTHTVPAAGQVELGFLIKLHLSFHLLDFDLSIPLSFF